MMRFVKPLTGADDPSEWKREISVSAQTDEPEWVKRRFESPASAMYTRMLFSCLVDADFLDTERAIQGETARGGFADIPVLLEKLNKHVAPWLGKRAERAMRASERDSGALSAWRRRGEGAVYADGADRRRKDDRIARVCAQSCEGTRAAARDLRYSIYEHHRTDGGGVCGHSRGAKTCWSITVRRNLAARTARTLRRCAGALRAKTGTRR